MFKLLPLRAIGFATVPIPNGHSWSLASVMGELLMEAERRFGPRDRSFTLLGVEFTSTDIPQTWYPGDRKDIIVQLTAQARSEPERAIYQLAHEIIHVLGPTSGMSAPVIEEGLATIFCEDVSRRQGSNLTAGMASYDRAADLLRPHLAKRPNIIAKIRAEEPRFSQLSAELLCRHIPEMLPADAIELCGPFART